ncbi:MerR family transcriptional regulator [Oenococcus kitaharae]|uniref:MerR family transcriptional regulator n=1 Tax=Oenococcus TaxID=46254 RepID=UPI0021E8E6F3|nr:MerR family transcriptional regulator [Oenococcus kitaharae]MCV3295643.1 MerR family transcriptional regulator [Oenococcus kitaharae]
MSDIQADTQFNDFTDFRPLIQSIVKEDKVLIGIADLSQATGVSQTQLRYWLEKGYIISRDDPKKKKFSYGTVFRVAIIKHLQDEGFTLAAAVAKADHHSAVVKAFKHLVADRLNGIQETDTATFIDFGSFDPQPDKHLIAKVTDTEIRFLIQ